MRHIRAYALMLAAVLCPAAARGVEPAAPQRGANPRQRLIGRERNGNSFRKPGTLLAEAKRDAPRIDLDELRQRKIDQVAHRRHHTRSLSPGPYADNDTDQAPIESEEENPDIAQADAPPAGSSFWPIALFLAGTAVAVFFFFRLSARRR